MSDAASPEPTRADIDARPGQTVLEFGTGWCGICRAAQPLIAAGKTAHPGVEHIRVEDGPGRPLGRSYGITLWPTLVFVDGGREVARVVRPVDAPELRAAYARFNGG